LEKYALDQRASSRPGWVPFMMKQAGVEWERIFDIFYVLFEEKMAPWHNEAALTFLVSDIGSLLSEWSASSLPLFLSSHPSISSIIEVLNPISLLLLQVLWLDSLPIGLQLPPHLPLPRPPSRRVHHELSPSLLWHRRRIRPAQVDAQEAQEGDDGVFVDRFYYAPLRYFLPFLYLLQVLWS
jgi:hypothetical protein